MADKGFNGTTVSFAGTGITPLISLNVEHTVTEADVGGAGDSATIIEPGVPVDKTVTVEVAGSATIEKGDKGAIAVVWNDNATTNFGDITAAMCVRVSDNGAEGDAITTTYVFKPSPA